MYNGDAPSRRNMHRRLARNTISSDAATVLYCTLARSTDTAIDVECMWRHHSHLCHAIGRCWCWLSSARLYINCCVTVLSDGLTYPLANEAVVLAPPSMFRCSLSRCRIEQDLRERDSETSTKMSLRRRKWLPGINTITVMDVDCCGCFQS